MLIVLPSPIATAFIRPHISMRFRFTAPSAGEVDPTYQRLTAPALQ